MQNSVKNAYLLCISLHYRGISIGSILQKTLSINTFLALFYLMGFRLESWSIWFRNIRKVMIDASLMIICCLHFYAEIRVHDVDLFENTVTVMSHLHINLPSEYVFELYLDCWKLCSRQVRWNSYKFGATRSVLEIYNTNLATAKIRWLLWAHYTIMLSLVCQL